MAENVVCAKIKAAEERVFAEQKRGMSCHAQFAAKTTERQIATIHKRTIMLLVAG